MIYLAFFILCCLLYGTWAAVTLFREPVRKWWLSRYEPIQPITAQVVEALRVDPDGWTADRYELRHPLGFVIWIANGQDALHLEVPGRGKVIETRANSHAFYADRRALWQAYMAWRFSYTARPYTPPNSPTGGPPGYTEQGKAEVRIEAKGRL